MNNRWMPLKICYFVLWLGKNRRGTGVYTVVHEDAELIFNDVREQKSHF